MNTDTQTAALLLDSVSAAVKNLEEQNQKTGRKYNIFKVAGIRHKELIVCRVIADLLNPKGLHCRGDAYLRLFIDMMDMVVKPSIKQAQKLDTSRANVITEYPIPGDKGNRRIDIVIEDGVVFIPIEAKIYAGDQENQVAAYAAFSRDKNRPDFIPVLFLTLDGHEPGNAKAGDFVCISFAKHIIPWLKKCLDLDATYNAAPIKEILNQFIRAIKRLCNHTEDEEMENAITSLITQSDDHYMTALRIKQAFESEELNFGRKAYEVFQNTISPLVKAKISGAKFLDKEGGWDFINIPVKNKFDLGINYDWKLIQVANTDDISDGEKSAIRQFMGNETHCSDENWESAIWVATKAQFPGLENTEDSAYLYQLYKIYSQSPQLVADRIIALANSLENILE